MSNTRKQQRHLIRIKSILLIMGTMLFFVYLIWSSVIMLRTYGLVKEDVVRNMVEEVLKGYEQFE